MLNKYFRPKYIKRYFLLLTIIFIILGIIFIVYEYAHVSVKYEYEWYYAFITAVIISYTWWFKHNIDTTVAYNDIKSYVDRFKLEGKLIISALHVKRNRKRKEILEYLKNFYLLM